MGRTTAARTLTGRNVSAAPRFDIRLAEAADDVEIRCLLREHALPGEVRLTLEREPDSTIAAAIEGDVQHTLIARERVTGRIAGIASRSERSVFVNGRVTRIGYLGQLRTNLRGHRVPSLLDEGFAFCRSLHDRGTVSAYLTVIVEGNHRAHRMLSGLHSPVAPSFTRVGTLTTLAIPRGHQRGRSRTGIEIRTGSVELLDDIVTCLNRNGRRHQFVPLWSVDDLISTVRTSGLAVDNFLVATRGSRVVGCAALWDQRAFKQAVVRGYSPQLAKWRRLINLAAPLFRIPALPPIGSPLEFVYLSHVAVDDDRAEVIAALVTEARRTLDPGVRYIVTAFSDGSPALAVAARVAPHRKYRSGLYLAFWPDGRQLVGSIDNRLPHPEVAIL